MRNSAALTYAPLDTLKPVVDNIWIVDGPIVEFGPSLLKMPFPTRMTIIRLDDGLFIHSPTPLTPALKAQIERIGTPRWIIGPNRIHYSWIGHWAHAYPAASVYLAPLLKERASRHFVIDGVALAKSSGYPWDRELATLPIAGDYMTEVEFFHRATRTLLLTDLIENFEPQKFSSIFVRGLAKLGGVLDPSGGMPRDMRLTFKRRKLKVAVETMILWKPDRIILAHGRWYEKDGESELRRAFQWLRLFEDI